MDFKEQMGMQAEMMGLLREIRDTQRYILNRLEAETGSGSRVKYIKVADRVVKESALALFVQDEDMLAKTKERLKLCSRPKEYALQAVYPLYEEEVVRAEVLTSKRFIEATMPFCSQMPTPTFENLRRAINTYCIFPR
ncbi:MAG: hypothetical protein HUK08_07385 [Bacteroidaceae bacterium]|nr:hypothetical protein [Bacteroidaceae bacterium]